MKVTIIHPTEQQFPWNTVDLANLGKERVFLLRDHNPNVVRQPYSIAIIVHNSYVRYSLSGIFLSIGNIPTLKSMFDWTILPTGYSITFEGG